MSDGADLSIDLRRALRRMPGPVSLITTCDPATGRPAGLAASAVIPATMEPPSMLVAINRSASAHAAISAAARFCINLLGTTQTALVGLFASSDLRERRFETDEWAYHEGIPHLPAACASIFCDVESEQVIGTHALFVGRAYRVVTPAECEVDPLGWIEGRFARLGAL